MSPAVFSVKFLSLLVPQWLPNGASVLLSQGTLGTYSLERVTSFPPAPPPMVPLHQSELQRPSTSPFLPLTCDPLTPSHS